VPDVFVVGLQETIPLNAINVLKGHDQERVDLFIKIFIKTLNLLGEARDFEYECFAN